jgi:hypothetical protein
MPRMIVLTAPRQSGTLQINGENFPIKRGKVTVPEKYVATLLGTGFRYRLNCYPGQLRFDVPDASGLLAIL